MAAKQLFQSRAMPTWKIYLRSAIKVWQQARIVDVNVFPLTNEKLMRVLGSVPKGKWKAVHWVQVRMYLKIVCSLNAFTLDPRINHMILGQAKQNVVMLARRKPRPVFSPDQMRNLFFKLTSLKKSHVQQRGILAMMLGYYAVGRSFDISFLQGKHLEFSPDMIKIHYHIRKNNPLALKRHVATIYATYNFLCPVLNIMKAIAYLRVGPDDFICHKEGFKQEQMESASIIASVKALQTQAKSSPALTLTDIRASATSALAEGGVSNYLIMLWGNWQTSQIQVRSTFYFIILKLLEYFKAYARSNDRLKRDIQGYLEP